MRAVKDGRSVYVVAIGGNRTGWLRNLRANPSVELRIRDGSFHGTARELADAERQRAGRIYANHMGAFEFLESLAHLPGKPSQARSRRLHEHWFRTGVPIVIDVQ